MISSWRTSCYKRAPEEEGALWIPPRINQNCIHTHMTGRSVSHVGERKTFSKMGWDRQKCAPRGVGKRAAIESLSSFTFQKTSRMYYSIKSFIQLLAEFFLKGGGFSTHTHTHWLQYMEWFSNSNSVLKAKSKMGTFILALSRYSIEMVLWSGSLQERAALDFCLSTRRFWGRPQFYSLLTDNRLDQLNFLLDVESFLKIVSSNLNSSQTSIFHDS